MNDGVGTGKGEHSDVGGGEEMGVCTDDGEAKGSGEVCDDCVLVGVNFLIFAGSNDAAMLALAGSAGWSPGSAIVARARGIHEI